MKSVYKGDPTLLNQIDDVTKAFIDKIQPMPSFWETWRERPTGFARLINSGQTVCMRMHRGMIAVMNVDKIYVIDDIGTKPWLMDKDMKSVIMQSYMSCRFDKL